MDISKLQEFVNQCYKNFLSLSQKSQGDDLEQEMNLEVETENVNKGEDPTTEDDGIVVKGKDIGNSVSDNVVKESKPLDLSCTECPFKSKRRYGLKRHMERIHKALRFACNSCGKSYSDKQNLRDHQKIHTSEAKTCCGKTLTPEQFKNHQNQWHSDKIFRQNCNKCDFVATSLSRYNSHT